MNYLILILLSITTANAEDLGGYNLDLPKETFLKTYQGFQCQDFIYGNTPEEAHVEFTVCNKPDPNFPDTYHGRKGDFDERHNLAAVRFYGNAVAEIIIRIPTGISTKTATEQLAKKSTLPATYHIGKTPPIKGSYYAGAGGVCSALFTLKTGIVYATAEPVQGKVNLHKPFEAGDIEFSGDENPKCAEVMNSDKPAAVLFYVNPKIINKSNEDLKANEIRFKQNNQTAFKF